MATGDLQTVDGTGNLQALLNLYSTAKGSSTSTTSNLSQGNVAEIIKSILGGSQGLSAVANGQKSAGLYNSSTNQKLINDLMARVTTQTAAQTAGTRTTKEGAIGSKELLTLLALSGGNKVLGPSLKKVGNPLDELGKKLSEAINGFGASSGSAIDPASTGSGYMNQMDLSSNLLDGAISSGASSGSADISIPLTTTSLESAQYTPSDFAGVANINGAVSTGQNINTAATSANYVNEMDKISDAFSAGSGDSSGSILGYLDAASRASNASKTDGDYRSAVGSAILNYFGAGALTPVADKVIRPLSDDALDNGQVANGTAGAIQAEPIGALAGGRYEGSDMLKALTDPADLFGGNEGGSISGTLGAALDPLGNALGGDNTPAAAISKWVICTELHAQGLLPQKLYAASAFRALELSDTLMRGYHSWAIPVTRRMRKSALLTKIILPVAIARCKYLLGERSFLGWATVAIGEPICTLIGKTIVRTDADWKDLYGQH